APLTRKRFSNDIAPWMLNAPDGPVSCTPGESRTYEARSRVFGSWLIVPYLRLAAPCTVPTNVGASAETDTSSDIRAVARVKLICTRSLGATRTVRVAVSKPGATTVIV